jgi:hypothetical protein
MKMLALLPLILQQAVAQAPVQARELGPPLRVASHHTQDKTTVDTTR